MNDQGKPVSRRAALTLGAATAAGGAVTVAAVAGGSPTAWAAPIIKRAVAVPAATASGITTLAFSLKSVVGADTLAEGETANQVVTVTNVLATPVSTPILTLPAYSGPSTPIRWSAPYVTSPWDVFGTQYGVSVVGAPGSPVTVQSKNDQDENDAELGHYMSFSIAPRYWEPGEELSVGFRVERNEAFIAQNPYVIGTRQIFSASLVNLDRHYTRSTLGEDNTQYVILV